VAQLLTTHPDWDVKFPPRLTSWTRRGLDGAAGLSSEQSSCLIRCSPEDGMNGFFVALFVKKHNKSSTSDRISSENTRGVVDRQQEESGGHPLTLPTPSAPKQLKKKRDHLVKEGDWESSSDEDDIVITDQLYSTHDGYSSRKKFRRGFWRPESSGMFWS
jgi:hypothetical protein